MNKIVERARVFATAAHGAIGQVRKYTGEPYIEHPKQVAQIVTICNGTTDMIAAAWLHDVLEDTKITVEIMGEHFSPRVVELVTELTEPGNLQLGNRATRKALERERLSRVSAQAQMIKMVDIYCNTDSIVEHDPQFAAVYLDEVELLMKVMSQKRSIAYRTCATKIEGARMTLRFGARNAIGDVGAPLKGA